MAPLPSPASCGTYVLETNPEAVCKKCPPGHFVKRHCNANDETECQVCPQGQYNSACTQSTMCASCDFTCNSLYGEDEKEPCTIVKNLKCGCPDGFYRNNKYEVCKKHTSCDAGYGVMKLGSENSDTNCTKCANGTFSSVDKNLKNPCKNWTECSGEQMQASPGNATHDRTCTSAIIDKTMKGGEGGGITDQTVLVIAAPICGFIVLALIACGLVYLWKRRNHPDGDNSGDAIEPDHNIPELKKTGNDDFLNCASYLAQHVLGKEHRFLLRDLGLLEAHIDRLQMRYADSGLAEAVYQGMLMFRNDKPEQAETPEILLKKTFAVVKNKRSRKILKYLAQEFNVSL